MPFVSLISADRIFANTDAFLLSASDGILYVRSGVLVASIGGSPQDGINVTGADTGIIIAGEVTGKHGLHVEGSSTEVNVVAGAIVSGDVAGIRATQSLDILNSGTIVGEGLSISASQFLRLVNHGTILGGTSISASGRAELTNAGFISGNVSLGEDADIIDNRQGEIAGGITLGSGNDIYLGGASREKVSDGFGEDEVDLGGGDDVMVMSNDQQADIFDGGDGRDTIAINNSASPVRVDLVRESISLTGGGTDLISGFEIFHLTNGADVFSGDSRANTVHGGSGDDILRPGSGNDRLAAGAGNDSLVGADGNDRLLGGAGNDQMNGGNGTDILRGGTGFDVMTGGANADLFLFGNAAEMQPVVVGAVFDRITDFVAGSDRIDVFTLDANTAGGAPDDAFVFRGTAGINGAGQIAVRQVAGNTFVDFAFATAVVEVTLQVDGLVTLTASDFLL